MNRPGNPGRDRGSTSVSTVLIVPAWVLFIGLLVVAGRIALAGNVVESAAHAAARDASLTRSAPAAHAAATDAAHRALQQQGVRCAATSVTVDSTGLHAALGQQGSVTATVTCQADLSEIGVPGLPGTKTLDATGTSPVDQYRER